MGNVRLASLTGFTATVTAMVRGWLGGRAIGTHLSRLTRVLAGCLRESPKRLTRMGQWIHFVLGVSVVLQGASPAPLPSPSAFPEVRASQGVLVERVLVLPAPAEASTRPMHYVVSTLRFTNLSGGVVTPRTARFVFVDDEDRRFAGLGSGQAPISGLSRDGTALAPAATREFTIAFCVPDGDTGTIIYDPT
ncbi:MAG TPA: hypothetical protein VGZ00_01755 [Candidatus Baltobacteraceae bacterium]|nr:hypothetical protein [Candidatus Baltobacteraceae bacterium]